MSEKTYRIETVYTLKAPLSHIGASESTETFLNTVSVRNGNKAVDVFAYTGNAIRGAWRDAGARYLLERLGNMQIPKKTFHLLFTGGAISGDQNIDIEQSRTLRAVLPFISIFGGGVGNQILSGKWVQTFAYPVCAETSQIIPQNNKYIDYTALDISWRKLTDEISFSRKDDSKDKLGGKYIQSDNLMLTTDKKSKKTEEPATQMRYTAEYLIPNTQLWHSLTITCNEVEMGALVASIHEWGKSPYLGGMGAKGFGLVDVDITITEDGKTQDFITINGSKTLLSEPAQAAKDSYDEVLKSLYTQYLDGNKEQIEKLLLEG